MDKIIDMYVLDGQEHTAMDGIMYVLDGRMDGHLWYILFFMKGKRQARQQKNT